MARWECKKCRTSVSGDLARCPVCRKSRAGQAADPANAGTVRARWERFTAPPSAGGKAFLFALGLAVTGLGVVAKNAAFQEQVVGVPDATNPPRGQADPCPCPAKEARAKSDDVAKALRALDDSPDESDPGTPRPGVRSPERP